MKNRIVIFSAIIIALLASCASTKKMVKTPCPKIILDSVTYTTFPCAVNVTVRKDEQADINILVIPEKLVSYAFTVYGYGEGMPVYGIISDEATGGAGGTITLHVHIRGKFFSLDNGKMQIYNGYLPIYIYHGETIRNGENCLKVPLKITVIP